jgi:hypothetical protein
VDVHLTGQVEDNFRHPMRLYGKMLAMAGNLGKGNDYPPTAQELAVNEEFKQRLADARKEYQAVVESETATFNAALKANGFTLAIRQ